MPTITLTSLASTERCLASFGDDVAYLVLSEVVDRNHSITAARINYSRGGLAPWWPEEDNGEAQDDEADLDGTDAERAEDEADDASPERVAAALCWIHETVSGLMVGRNEARFKVGLWAPGGKAMLHSARFEARTTVSRHDLMVQPAPEPISEVPPGHPLAPTVAVPTRRAGPYAPEEAAWQALGDGYTHLVALTQSTYAHVAKLQSASIQALSQQNSRLYGVVESLSDDLRNVHIGTAQATRDEERDAVAAGVRATLGRQFIDQLGSLGRTLVAAKSGLPPELAEVAEAIADAPELLGALRSPAVKALLRDDGRRAELAMLLRAAAETMGGETVPEAAATPSDNAAAGGTLGE